MLFEADILVTVDEIRAITYIPSIQSCDMDFAAGKIGLQIPMLVKA